MLQQAAFARRTNAVDIIQRIDAEGLRTFGPVRANRKPVRFIAQTLHEIQNRIFGFKHDRALASGHMEMFTPAACT